MNRGTEGLSQRYQRRVPIFVDHAQGFSYHYISQDPFSPMTRADLSETSLTVRRMMSFPVFKDLVYVRSGSIVRHSKLPCAIHKISFKQSSSGSGLR